MSKFIKKEDQEMIHMKCIIKDTAKYTLDKKSKMIGRTTVCT